MLGAQGSRHSRSAELLEGYMMRAANLCNLLALAEEEYWKQEQEAIRKAEEEADNKRKLQQEIMVSMRAVRRPQ